MKKILLLLLFVRLAGEGFAHPGIGIVKDSQGNIYYTDLKQVWKITGDERTVVVRNVHTHELHIDPSDNLYGEHQWYNGEKLNTWGHYIWRLRSDGVLLRVREATEGFRENYSFVQDGSGNMYWVERWKVSRFRKKTPNGNISIIAEGKYTEVRWIHCTRNGVLYFLDCDKLYAIEKNKTRLLASDLKGTTTAFSFVGERHSAYGVWTDKADNVYVALHGGQQVKKIEPNGKVTTIVHSSSPWSPTSGVFDDDGNLWLQEYTISGDCRVRKIALNKLSAASKAAAFPINSIFSFAIAGGMMAILWTVVKKMRVFRCKRATH